MILYKYYNFNAGKSALESERVGFRTPTYFNDPFEASVIEGKSFTKDRIQNTLNNVAILSLTRNPLNSLMWAHYGDEHKGFVIGYEVETPFFKCKESNLIPVHKGSVIYMIDHLFLNKDTIWSYEEEVRIVKRISSVIMETHEYWENPYNRYSTLSREIRPGHSKEIIPGLKIYDHQIKIKEVYLGARNPHFEDRDEHILELLSKIQKKGAKIYSVSVDSKSWNLTKKLLNTP
ncbi:DUF2971 domain-containing protein [Acinetobacter junii]|uniref:DUF2971 domain-containing protein n=1 Tax=Acinetobacter junii TaxID=40215 RepID=UPI000F68D930|nr:DUF2971 domain-containing protein [Acinetobacter junii]RSE30108.1 DUF2971 domain-containing protein [Acinetobacter junii]